MRHDAATRSKAFVSVLSSSAMKPSVFALIVAVSLSALSALGAAPKEGAAAPRAQVKTLAGQTLDTEALKGKVVVIGFWATWCTYCRQELADLERFYQRHGSDGLEIISINMDDAQQVDEVRKIAAGVSFPVALQRDAAFKGYGRIWRLPLTFVIDRRGILRRDGWDSEPSVTYKQLEETVGPLLKDPA